MITPPYDHLSAMDHDQHYGHQIPYLHSDSHWGDQSAGHSHHASPVHEYTGFTFSSSPLSMDPGFGQNHHHHHHNHHHQHQPIARSSHHQLQPLVVPQWPSLIASQASYNAQHHSAPAAPPAPPAQASPPQLLPAPSSAQPHLASSSPVHHTPTPRKTLTDHDRRRMCIYHEEHPTKKQTEIGEMFGVERSTVSKVLRNKDKYLLQDDGNRSPVKRSKGKFPDIERALTNWAKNQEQKGCRLTDDMIREQAKFFSATVPGGAEMAAKMNSTSWLEKFKQKNNLMGFRSSKGSATPADTLNSATGITGLPSSLSPTMLSRTTSPTASPLEMVSVKSQDSGGDDKPRMHVPFHSQSNTSLSSAFTDATTSTFSTANTSSNSPLFSPAAVENGTPFFQGSTMNVRSNTMPAPAVPSHRPRSQTFPSLGAEPYLSPPSSTQDPVTPKFSTSTSPLLTSPVSEMEAPDSTTTTAPAGISVTEPSFSYTDYQHSHHQTYSEAQRKHTSNQQQQQQQHQHPTSFTFSSMRTNSDPTLQPTHEDARRALELFLTYAQNQPPSSGLVEPQEYVTIGKLMARLRVHSDGGLTSPRLSVDVALSGPTNNSGGRSGSLSMSRSGSVGGVSATDADLPGGLHRIPEHEFANGSGDVD